MGFVAIARVSYWLFSCPREDDVTQAMYMVTEAEIDLDSTTYSMHYCTAWGLFL